MPHYSIRYTFSSSDVAWAKLPPDDRQNAVIMAPSGEVALALAVVYVRGMAKHLQKRTGFLKEVIAIGNDV